jgi:hypothetical protein
MSVFNNGFLGFAEQIDNIQNELDEIETLQTENNAQLTTISTALGEYGWCSDWYIPNDVTFALATTTSLLSPDYMTGFPYAGTYMLIGGASVYAESTDPIQNVGWFVYNQSTSTYKGLWYCTQANNSLGVNSDYLGGNLSIRFTITAEELEDDFDVRIRNYSTGDNASEDITTFTGGDEIKWRCIYLGPASPL